MSLIPITKVDAGKRLVYGRIDETPDRSGQIMDYATSKPFYEAWSAEMLKASDGKSLGNLRAMHGLKAAGRVVSIEYDDAGKAIDLVAEVVDDADWTKVEKGVYTGFSPGGKFGRKWRDGKFERYTGMPREMSLVDLPAIPSAGFTMLKADGAEELIPFAEPTVESRAALLTERLAEADGVAAYRAIVAAEPDDMIKALFPDGDPDWLQAERAALAEPPPAETGDMIKGLCEVAQLAGVIEQLTWLAQNVNWEAEIEGDGSKLPGQLAAWIKTGAGILTAMAAEESGEAVTALTAAVAALPIPVDVVDMTKMELADWLKAGARNSASDQQVIQTIHDHANALGAVCPPSDGDMSKIGYMPQIARLTGDTVLLRDEMRQVVADRDMLKLRISALEKEPMPGGPRLKVVDRADDHGGGGSERANQRAQRRAAIDAMPPGKARAVAETKFAMEFPG